MKLQFEGHEVETITDGYWPEGVELICSDDGINWGGLTVVCLNSGVCLCFGIGNEAKAMHWKYWAIKPTNLAPRRLTNREVANLCKKGWDILTKYNLVSYAALDTRIENENKSCRDVVFKLRAPDSDEWLDPTTALLEVGKC